MDAASARLVGARVVLRGLVAKPAYNGRVGTVTVLSRVGTRYKVALDVDSEAGAISVNLKRDNIRAVVLS